MITKIDEQLNWIIEILEKNKVEYVVDSGTLLGIIREGKLIKWDKDIDIIIFDKDIKKMSYALEEVKNRKDYKMSVGKYRGLIVGYTLSPDNIYHNLLYPYIPLIKLEGNRKIDIMVLRRKGDLFWMPLRFPIGSDKTGFVYYFYKLTRGLNVLIQRIFFKNKKLKPKTPKRSKSGTLIIPVKYLEKTKTYKNLRIPYMTNKYLDYRYGEWEKPVKHWIYTRDEKSCKKESPEEMGFITNVN